MSSSNDEQRQPGLIAGHAQYIKGAAVNAIGNISGSEAWSTSGEEQKKHAVDAMKEASEQRDPQQGYGKAEEIAGKLSGCEGMQKEGAASKED
ncbi:uncharacterized protein BDZ99DRAFT_412196 [Mytilinidion resinicola]|uniref:CsbD-like domain-containing protein n=1 Tax=Mytilinidion resinicola TaxID=574789 RepID=A0A6A6YWY0_9PEZI|nr:uncharacterized protein BDZ99DRAFT_412196 [Mytilinidion resinicola]KAF2813442.1 hypothetical protein BDZ99DRAFT_412196 [Mytilinidion resinicola]